MFRNKIFVKNLTILLLSENPVQVNMTKSCTRKSHKHAEEPSPKFGQKSKHILTANCARLSPETPFKYSSFQKFYI